MGENKKSITLTGKAACDALIEHSLQSGAHKQYPQQPFLYGYEVISFAPDIRYSIQMPLSAEQKSLVERFIGRPWNPGRPYLRRLKSLLIQRCNVQNPDGLTWEDILTHIVVYFDDRSKQAEPTDATGKAETKKTAPKLDKIRSRVWLSGEWHDLSENECAMMAILIRAKGAWVAGKSISKDFRPDRTKKNMSEPVRNIIQTHTTHGYRIKPELFL